MNKVEGSGGARHVLALLVVLALGLKRELNFRDKASNINKALMVAMAGYASWATGLAASLVAKSSSGGLEWSVDLSEVEIGLGEALTVWSLPVTFLLCVYVIGRWATLDGAEQEASLARSKIRSEMVRRALDELLDRPQTGSPQEPKQPT